MNDNRPPSSRTARNRRAMLVCLALAIALLLAGTALLGPGEPADEDDGNAGPPERIISMAPSITETLFRLGLGDRVVGVTRFCDFPPAARDLPDVGGYFDPSYETITGLEPDLVILLPDHEEMRRHLAAAGIETMVVDHATIEGICKSFRRIAAACDVPARGGDLADRVRSRLDAVAARVAGRHRPRVLVAVGRDVYSETIREVFIAGNRGWYTELIRLAGGVNAYGGELAFPAVSAEGILQMAPDVIIEMTGATRPDFHKGSAMAAWEALKQVPAVREGRVHFFREDFAVIPGPRVAQLLERLARTLHPDADWPAPRGRDAHANETTAPPDPLP